MSKDIGVDANIDRIRIKEVASPSTPASGYGYIYAKTDGLYFKGDGGTEVGPLAAASGGLSNSAITPTTANVSADVNTRYFADTSGLTGNRNFILPSATTGDQIELVITTGDDTYELIIIGDTGITINGGSAATEWGRIYAKGQSVKLIATSTTNWIIAQNGIRESYVLIQEQQTSGTNAGTFTAGSFVTRTLNTEVKDDDNIATLSSNQITLRAGTYRVRIFCPAVGVNAHRAKLVNVTDTADLLLSDSAYSAVNEIEQPAIIVGEFTLTGTKALEVQHRAQTTKTDYGMGSGYGAFSLTEIYGSVEIWRKSPN